MSVRFGLLMLAFLWTTLYGVVQRFWILDFGFWIRKSTVQVQNQKFLSEVIAATGLLALATVGFFWQILLTPNAWMPAGGGDLAPFLYPNYHFAAEHVRQGVIPLWNPHLYSGAPFAADIQSGLFYPVNLLIFLLVPKLTFEWLEYLAIFHFWLAGTTMYLCLRLLFDDVGQTSVCPAPHNLSKSQKSLSPMPAFAGALAFEFSDLFIVHFGNLNMIAVAAWLPLVFLLFYRSLLKSSFGLAAASGAILAIATLAGHIQITLFILITVGLLAVWWLFAEQSPFVPRLFRSFTSLLLCLLVTVGLSALLILPAYQMSGYTPRAELPYNESVAYSLQPVQLIGLLIPNYFGRDPALHWGPWERVETGYIGILTLLLAMIGLFLHPSRLKYYFFGLAIIALLLAMGGYTVLHGWLYATVPGFNQLRAPARFILLLDFSLATLAAMGLHQLRLPLDRPTQETLAKLLKPLTWGLGAIIVVATPLAYYAMLITQDRDPSIFHRASAAATGVVTFAILTIASLVWLHLAQRGNLLKENPSKKMGFFEGFCNHGVQSEALTYSKVPLCYTVDSKTSIGLAAILLIGLDLFTLGHNVDVGHANPTAKFDHPAALAFLQSDPNFFRLEVTTDVWHLWQPDSALLHHMNDVWGLYNPLTLADTTLYWSGAPPRSSGRYNFLGIKYIIASKAGAPADGNIVPVFDADPDINIYLNLEASSRLLFVHQATVVANHEAAWQAIRTTDFDPTKTVILEQEQILSGGDFARVDNGKPFSSTLALLQYDNDMATIALTSDQPGYLVLSEAYYPGWQAMIDGQPTPIYRANYAFRAVHVSAGAHTIKFVFAPLIWKIGLAISGLTLLGLLSWLGISVLPQRVKKQPFGSNTID